VLGQGQHQINTEKPTILCTSRLFLRKFYGNRMLSCVRLYEGFAGMGDGGDIKSNQT